ncbi:MAG: hypothetical protein ACI4DK_03240 [Lachnospiraceae bacterium]
MQNSYEDNSEEQWEAVVTGYDQNGNKTGKWILKGKYTDMALYLENIIYKFLNIDVRLLSYKIEEYED